MWKALGKKVLFFLIPGKLNLLRVGKTDIYKPPLPAPSRRQTEVYDIREQRTRALGKKGVGEKCLFYLEKR